MSTTAFAMTNVGSSGGGAAASASAASDGGGEAAAAATFTIPLPLIARTASMEERDALLLDPDHYLERFKVRAGECIGQAYE